jgi:preprotein translocase subunit SecB
MADSENNAVNNQAGATGAEKPDANFEIRKIYLKDASCESPNSPGIFLTSNQQPDVSIDASIKVGKLDQEDYYDVVLGITVTSKVEEQTAFLVEVHQAGVFHIAGVADEDMPLALQIACPNVLLPFAREAISDLVTKAGFPQLLLSPINFEALYQQKVAQEKAAPDDETAH